MTAEVKKIEEILGSSFSMDNYVALIGEIFSSAKIIAPGKQYPERSNFSFHIVGYSHVATYMTPDEKKLVVLAVELKKNSYVITSRSTQRSYAKKLIENSNSDAAVIAFYTVGDLKWRLSFVRLDYEMNFENGRLKAVENMTPAKRYSFLVGKDEPSHTAVSRLHSFITDKDSQPTLDELEDVFSVEKVTKEFFDLYCEKYHELREYLLTNEDFLVESEKCGFTVEQFAKKLMGQIVFLYFLQKKGWLGVGVWPKELTEKQYKNVFFIQGAPGRLIKEYLPQVYLKKDDKYVFRSASLDLIPDEVEELIANNLPKDESKTWGNGSTTFLRTVFDYSKRRGKNFYDDYLEPLFYGTLNKNRGEMAYCPLLHCRVPFLSGGLFEPMNGYRWDISEFNIPDYIFSNRVGDDDRTGDGILDIFDRYNFTMSEDEPMEREVAIDPEMLGKVFENLLDVTDRKSKGAFYTPREIVHYMCQESLINYLARATELPEADIRDIILYGDFMKDEDTEKTIPTVDENGTPHMKFDYNKDMLISENILSFKNGVNRLEDIDHALADIRVADPAVGSGAFPLGMLNEIVRARQCLTEYMALVVAKPAVSENQASFFIRELRRNRTAYDLKRYAIKNSIFAADIEPSAVDIARLRLWLSLVIDDEINPEANIDMLDGHRNPLPLPNLECNIICGNSLIDEFEGVALLNQSDLLGIHRDGGQRNIASNAFEAVLPKLLKAQDDLFYCDDPAKKAQLIEQISALKGRAIEPQLYAMSPESKERYKVAKDATSLPFILWELEFARVFRDKGGFDVVIGNPPYVLLQDMQLNDSTEKYYRAHYKVASYKVDLYHMFIEKGSQLLHSDGVISFITPSNFTTNNYCDALRKYLLNNHRLVDLIYYDENVFQANVNNLVFVAMKSQKDTGNNLIHMMKARKSGNDWEFYVKSDIVQSTYMHDNYIIVPIDSMDSANLIAFIEKVPVKLKELASINFGMQLRDRKKFPADVTKDITLLTQYHKPCYTGKDIHRYNIVYGGLYCYFNREAKKGGCWEAEAQLANPKLVCRQIGQYPIFGIDTKGYPVLNTAFMVSKFDSSISPYALLGILNSNVIRFYWIQKFSDNRKQFPKIKGTYLEQLPIARNKNAESKIESLVRKRLGVTDVVQAEEIENSIECCVYELYELADFQISVIESFLRAMD